MRNRHARKRLGSITLGGVAVLGSIAAVSGCASDHEALRPATSLGGSLDQSHDPILLAQLARTKLLHLDAIADMRRDIYTSPKITVTYALPYNLSFELPFNTPWQDQDGVTITVGTTVLSLAQGHNSEPFVTCTDATGSMEIAGTVARLGPKGGPRDTVITDPSAVDALLDQAYTGAERMIHQAADGLGIFSTIPELPCPRPQAR